MDMDASNSNDVDVSMPRTYITKPRPLNEYDEKLKPPVVAPPRPKIARQPAKWNRKSRAEGPDDPMDPSCK